MEANEGESPEDRQLELVQVSCIRCERLHPVETPLVFNPVCPACT